MLPPPPCLQSAACFRTPERFDPLKAKPGHDILPSKLQIKHDNIYGYTPRALHTCPRWRLSTRSSWRLLGFYVNTPWKAHRKPSFSALRGGKKVSSQKPACRSQVSAPKRKEAILHAKALPLGSVCLVKALPGFYDILYASHARPNDFDSGLWLPVLVVPGRDRLFNMHTHTFHDMLRIRYLTRHLLPLPIL